MLTRNVRKFSGTVTLSTIVDVVVGYSVTTVPTRGIVRIGESRYMKLVFQLLVVLVGLINFVYPDLVKMPRGYVL